MQLGVKFFSNSVIHGQDYVYWPRKNMLALSLHSNLRKIDYIFEWIQLIE